jgi:Cdc6-like AAA superfamily ATPase
LIEKKYLLIKGKPNSGKTITLKYIYCKLCEDKTPIYYDVESINVKKYEKLIENLFEEQYSHYTIIIIISCSYS